jgi:tRNA threonylcarbamoyladenosine biosynthesis protein TsaB
MNLIAIDTSGDACSAALLWQGALTQRLETTPRKHGELILAMLDELLARTGARLRELNAVAFGRGPGSFTGVRIACSVAQGVAFGAGLPTVPVSTLAAIASGERRRGGSTRVLAALDARMGEVYWGAYEVESNGVAKPCAEELVCPPGQVPIPAGTGWQGAGSGFATHGAELAERLAGRLAGTNPEAICEARDLIPLALAAVRAGETVAPELARPVYLRDRVTHRS